MKDTEEKANIQNFRRKKNITRDIQKPKEKCAKKLGSNIRRRPENPVAILMIVVASIDVPTTISIVDTETAPMTNVVNTAITIIEGIGTIIRAIGGLGINGIDTQETIRRYTNMEDITAKMNI